MDILGRVLQQQKAVSVSDVLQSAHFEISTLAAGTYFVRWVEGGMTKAFVK